MKISTRVILSCFLAALSLPAIAQQPSLYLNYYKTPKNTLPLTGYYQIGGYKVKGNPYYHPEFILGDFYSVQETAKNVYLRYDVYNQKIEFVSSANQDQLLVKEPSELDSFVIYKKEKKEIVTDIKMVYGSIIGAPDKSYYQQLHEGEKYSLYKKYVAELVVPIDRTGHAESRVFEIQTQYWYVDEKTKTFKQVTGTAAALKKEFKGQKDLSGVIKGGSLFKNVDEGMSKVFVALND